MPRMLGQLKKPSKPLQTVSEYDRCLLYRLDGIALYMQCTPRTVKNWINRHGFPAAKTPNGGWVSSTALIDLWILSRMPRKP